MNNLPKMYSIITLSDGRKGIVVDYMGDDIIVDVGSSVKDWDTIIVTEKDGQYCPYEEDGVAYTLCHRKEIRLFIAHDKIYTFLFGDTYICDYDSISEEKYHQLCYLLSIDPNADIEKSWNHFFEYNPFHKFHNAYSIIQEDEFYYVYGYDEAEKTADALYRFEHGIFERFFPEEGIWRSMPEQRMILNEKKPRYQKVSKEEGLSLSLPV